MTRIDLLRRIVELAGSEIVTVVDDGSGWPSIIEVTSGANVERVAAHVADVGLSHRGRDDVERRIQNPGSRRAEASPSGAFPAILGLWEEEGTSVLVGWDAQRRLGKETRHSMFIPLEMLRRAAQQGWASHQSTSEEVIIAFAPALLPSYIEARLADEPLPDQLVAPVLQASGFTDEADQAAKERARVAMTRLVRDAEFGRRVVAAYGGRCAMCGIDMQLVEGAHVYPVQAKDSPDFVQNGIGLCSNHHRAFDLHLIWVDPASRELRIHPSVLGQTAENPAHRQFIETTGDVLRDPVDPSNRVGMDMLQKRYSFFEGQYDWAAERKPGL